VFFIAFIASCGESRKPSRAVEEYSIAILPFHGFSDKRAELIANEIALFYHVKVTTLPSVEYFDHAKLAGTERYDARIILKELLKKIPKGYDKILGLSDRDIFTEKTVNAVKYSHWGIFGLGYQPGRACIVSDFRLLKFGKETDSLVVKVALHEMGHTFGLPHCNRDQRCMMNDAKGTVKTLFHENEWLCAYCAGVIQKQIQ